MKAAALLALVLLACGKDAAAPAPPGPTLQVTNHSYHMLCNPYCQPPVAVDPLWIGVWATTSDTIYVVDTTSFDSTSCVRLPGSIGTAWGWKQYVKGMHFGYGIIYYSADTVIDLSTSPGWAWNIQDVVIAGGVEHHATFTPVAACPNPKTVP